MSPLGSPDAPLSMTSSSYYIWDAFQECGWALLSFQLARAEQDPPKALTWGDSYE